MPYPQEEFESSLEEDEYLAIEKMGLIAFAHGRYYTLGRDLGAFGFSVDNKIVYSQHKKQQTKRRGKDIKCLNHVGKTAHGIQKFEYTQPQQKVRHKHRYAVRNAY